MNTQSIQVTASRRTELANLLVSKILTSPALGNGTARAPEFTDLDISGDIDLSQVKLEWPVVIKNCSFQEIDLSEASVPGLILSGCTFSKLTARHLEVSRGDLDLRGSAGTIDISGAHVRDDVHLEGAKPRGAQCALRADGIHVGGDFVCRSSRKSRFICDGRLSLDGAEILGTLHLEGARLNGPGRNNRSCAFSGGQLKVGAEFEAQHLKSCGGICLIGLQVTGELNFSGARITSSKLDVNNPTGVVLDRCHIGGSLFCDDGFSCIGGLQGIGSVIEGSAYFNGATLTSPNPDGQGRALELNRAHISGILDLCHWRKPSPVRVSHKAAELRSFDGTSFTWNPDHLTFASDGVVGLAHVAAGRTRIETGHIRGRLYPPAEGSKDEVRVAVDLNQFRTQMLVLDGGPGPKPESQPTRNGARIDLTGATLGILLDYLIDEATAATKEHVYPAILRGCTYNLIHQARQQEVRLAWLDKGSTFSRHMKPDLTVCYRSEAPFAQPYQQAADASGRAGNDASRRAVLWRMNQAVNQTRIRGTVDDDKGASSRAVKKAWNWFQDATIGYGYRPGLAATWLLILWVVGVVSFWFFSPESTASHPRGMSSVEHITYPLDLMIPLVGLGVRSNWHPVGIYPQVLAAALIAFGWIFSITVLAAITRIARRS